MLDMFSNICGFYFHYKGDPVPDVVNSWNVTSLELDRNNLHNDVQTAQAFFETVVKFLDARRNEQPTSKYAARPSKLAYR